MRQGAAHEVLRTLCQVVNATQFLLEVRIVAFEDGDWEAIPSPAGETRPPAPAYTHVAKTVKIQCGSERPGLPA